MESSQQIINGINNFIYQSNIIMMNNHNIITQLKIFFIMIFLYKTNIKN